VAAFQWRRLRHLCEEMVGPTSRFSTVRRCRQPAKPLAALDRHVFDTARTFAQEGYLAGCNAYNEDPGRRRCSKCGREHPAVDLVGYRWETLAEQLRV
jgi:hypothetical protein